MTVVLPGKSLQVAIRRGLPHLLQRVNGTVTGIGGDYDFLESQRLPYVTHRPDVFIMPTKARDFISRLYDHIKLIVYYDTTTEDGVKVTASTKLDLVGGLDLEPDERVTWSPKNSHKMGTTTGCGPGGLGSDGRPLPVQCRSHHDRSRQSSKNRNSK